MMFEISYLTFFTKYGETIHFNHSCQEVKINQMDSATTWGTQCSVEYIIMDKIK